MDLYTLGMTVLVAMAIFFLLAGVTAVVAASMYRRGTAGVSRWVGAFGVSVAGLIASYWYLGWLLRSD